VERQLRFAVIRCLLLGASNCYTQWLACKGRTAVTAMTLCETPPYKIQWPAQPSSGTCALQTQIFSLSFSRVQLKCDGAG